VPDFAFPSVGPLGLGSPPSRRGGSPYSRHRYYAQLRLPIAPFGSFALRLSPIPVLLQLRLSLGPGAAFPNAGGFLFRPFSPNGRAGACRLLAIGRSPKFPSCPRRHMPRSQTPVVSCTLALSCTGLLPSIACRTSAFPLRFVERIIHCPRLYTFRGSLTRPVPLVPSAPYARYQVCT
jgi:hypothetical protein